MALNEKKSGFGFDLEEKFKKVTTNHEEVVQKEDPKPAEKVATKQQQTAAEPKEQKEKTPHIEFKEPEKRELKQQRVQFLTYESLIARMDAYAEKRGVKRVAVFEAAITAYLDKVESFD